MAARSPFRTFWLGQSLSALGDAFAMLAMPLLVLEATHSVEAMGRVTGVAALARVASGFAAGVIVDRVDRRRLMIVCDWGRAGVYALLAAMWAWRGPNMPLLYATQVVGNVLGMTFMVAYVTAIPNLVPRDEVVAANGRLQVSHALAQILGPALAGALAEVVGPAGAIAVDALSFAVSAVSLAAIRFARPPRAPDERAPAAVSLLAELREGMRFLLEHPLLRTVTWLLALVGFVEAGVNDLLVFRIEHELGHGHGMVGLVLGAGSVGALAAGVGVRTIRERLGFGPSFLGGMALASLAMATLGITGTVVGLGLGAAAFHFAETIKGVSSMSMRQQVTPDRLLGRVTAIFWVLVSGLGPLGAVVATRIAGEVGTRPVLACLGGVMLVCAVAGVRSPARVKRPAGLAS